MSQVTLTTSTVAPKLQEHPVIRDWLQTAQRLTEEENAIDVSLVHCIIFDMMKSQPDVFTEEEVSEVLDLTLAAIGKCPRHMVDEVLEEVSREMDMPPPESTLKKLFGEQQEGQDGGKGAQVF